MRASRGFTLLELMIALAVVAILATLAMPSLQASAIRSQVVEGVGVAQFVKAAVQAAYAASGVLPADNAAAGVPPADRIVGNDVSAVTVRDGAVVVTFGNQANRSVAGHRLTLRPALADGYPQVPIAWVCAQAPVPATMSVHGVDVTDLQPAWLPLNCRAGAPAAPR